MLIGTIFVFSVAGLVALVIGGHSVGDFAGILVERLEAAGHPDRFYLLTGFVERESLVQMY